VDGSGLLGEGFGPLLFFSAFGFLFGGDRTLPWPLPKREGDVVLAAGVLEIGAEPADRAAAFIFCAIVVEGDEASEDFFVGEVDGPAVGIGNGGMEVVVNLAEDGDGRRLPESGNYVLSVAFAPDPASVLCSNHFCTEVVGAYYCRAAGKLRAREVS
jgi:hypothetical protein